MTPRLLHRVDQSRKAAPLWRAHQRGRGATPRTSRHKRPHCQPRAPSREPRWLQKQGSRRTRDAPSCRNSSRCVPAAAEPREESAGRTERAVTAMVRLFRAFCAGWLGAPDVSGARKHAAAAKKRAAAGDRDRLHSHTETSMKGAVATQRRRTEGPPPSLWGRAPRGRARRISSGVGEHHQPPPRRAHRNALATCATKASTQVRAGDKCTRGA